MACIDVDMDIHGDDEEPSSARLREPPRIKIYQATESVPDDKLPLHDLQQTQPAVLGYLQMMSGLLSLGVGIVFALTQDVRQYLSALFRVSHLSGLLFIIAGTVSNLLFKYPQLVPVSLNVNCGCIIVAVVGACLISVDLAHWSPEHDPQLTMKLLELCLLGMEAILSVILCFCLIKVKRSESP